MLGEISKPATTQGRVEVEDIGVSSDAKSKILLRILHVFVQKNSLADTCLQVGFLGSLENTLNRVG